MNSLAEQVDHEDAADDAKQEGLASKMRGHLRDAYAQARLDAARKTFAVSIETYEGSFGELVQELQDGEVWEDISPLPVKELFRSHLFNNKGSSRRRGPSGPRLSADELQKKVLGVFEGTSPGDTLETKDIVDITGLNQRRVLSILGQLTEDNKIVKNGNRRTTTWSVSPS